MTEPTLPYREHQKCRPPIWGTVAATLVLLTVAYAVVRDLSARWLVQRLFMFSCFLAGVWLGGSGLTVLVDRKGVLVRFGLAGPGEQWRPDQIRRCEVVAYDARSEWKGWGGRHRKDGARCYSAHGDAGVLLDTDKRKVLIGSQRPDELAGAIRALLAAQSLTGERERQPSGSR